MTDSNKIGIFNNDVIEGRIDGSNHFIVD